MMYTPVLYTFAIISFVHLIFTESLPCTRQWSRPLILLELVIHGEGWGRRVAVVRTWRGRQTNPTRKNIHVMQSLLTGYKPQTLRCLSECRCRVCWERRKNTWPGRPSACPPARLPAHVVRSDPPQCWRVLLPRLSLGLSTRNFPDPAGVLPSPFHPSQGIGIQGANVAVCSSLWGSSMERVSGSFSPE